MATRSSILFAAFLLSIAQICRSQDVLWEYCGNEPADVAFLLDSSNSIWGPDFRRQIRFVKDVVSMFQIGSNATRVGLVTYNDHVELQFHLSRYMDKDRLLWAIDNVREGHGYSTATDLALQYMRTFLFTQKGGGREGVAKVGIVITDGKSRNMLRTLIEASRAKKENIHLFAIGVGQAVNDRELRRMASSPSSDYFFQVTGYSALDSLKKILAIKTCQVTRPPSSPPTTPKSTTTATTTTPTTTTTTTTEPTTTTSTPTTTTTTTTEPPTTTTTTSTTTTTVTTTSTIPTTTTTTWLDMVAKECKGKMLDLVFALDVSDAVSYADFWQMIRFIRDFTLALDIGRNATRLGVVLYSNHVYNGFDLDEYDNLNGLVSHLYKLEKSTGEARPDEMIRYVRTKAFRRSVARKGAAQVVIVLTTSASRHISRVKKQAKRAQESGLNFIVVGVGDNIKDEEMKVITGLDPVVGAQAKTSKVHIIPPKSDNEATDMIRELEEDDYDDVNTTVQTLPNPESTPRLETGGQQSRNSIYRLKEFSELEDILMDAMLQSCSAKSTDKPVADQPCGTRQPADMMFVVDSANAGKKNTKKVMDFMKSLAGDMAIDRDNIQMGLLAPDPCAPQEQSFQLNQNEDKEHVMNSLSTETTDFSDLVRDMRKNGFRETAGGRKDAKRVAVLIVDGTMDNPLRALTEARQAREKRGIEIYVISVGTEIPQPEMMMMCDYPTQKHFYHLESYDELPKMEDTIRDILCDEL
ncbi:cartilage matrix protein-like isoform X1 [Pomacea canaliculata]|uniref:cartilage matrix protein-like isoform X1 n=1 Tax=Pomacea canaliculata TaxID=400727 RepID=UPI000D73DA76|nr:cartilage matrix protein-like isoform X1 [Pomacea canaliculata]